MTILAETRAADTLQDDFQKVRALTAALATPLSDADASGQSMPDASPAKWHLAHTTWFLETFLLAGRSGYRLFDDRFGFLFNSYYESVGPRLRRDRRGMLTRPSLDDVLAFRAHVDAAMVRHWQDFDTPARALVTLAINHEQQHQELLLTDILDLFAANPLEPALFPHPGQTAVARPGGWTRHAGGICRIGHDGAGFAFDCEGPAHDVLLRPFALADTLVTNADWIAFIDAGGYRDPRLWLSDGWAWVQRDGIAAPLRWQQGPDGWSSFTLSGRRAVDPAAPVTHLSFYEADAFASWAGARLPTEAEWEVAAAGADPAAGVQLNRAGPVAPVGSASLFGDCWQWTASAFLPYPGFRAVDGAVGEYNGKFMNGQMVLKGASCATPRGSSRASVRNFFTPAQRWQFTGLRLAKDI
ncbi:ergothioneine biosynthesis protein EgtB [Polymorphobacter fuscus]|uniref:Ergothioneine biosynthesis protein EgtB n=1 Tax=Sandarakinorhabdus fusca TaxID=1439888 RepID=A0A7C9KHF0_9SPHN|nr:ergothioneine biosynthesis protein EgtB [Polymorphobacter fuscus]KAB7647538.1 ergothioneine biosynthesis protein EgtB [Polymorphobacter fuscus]MQT16800.1 ergothioneine biosynthesis protein EgtB [Polymorphobacter fuscus]NJC09211.1 ergothioneine biosynthesis protein EgtB [Polymorphobacter fuscus]